MQTVCPPGSCAACYKPTNVCVCARLERFPTRLRLLILQHPQEQDFLLGSARLAALALPKAQLEVGLSWGSLSHALGQHAESKRWAVLYPNALPREKTPAEVQRTCLVWDRHGGSQGPSSLTGLVVLDGTWSQVKALWWRNPWLLKLGRVILHPREPSIYGRLRREPRPECVSTLEAIGSALEELGEPSEVNVGLRRIFRTMVQRARDASRHDNPVRVR